MRVFANPAWKGRAGSSFTDPRQDACGNIAAHGELAAIAQCGCWRTPAQGLRDASAILSRREEILGKADAQRMCGQGLDRVVQLANSQRNQSLVIGRERHTAVDAVDALPG